MPNAHERQHQDLLKRFAENLRRERTKAGLTQEELAEMVNLSARMIQKVEYGNSNILATTAIRLREALGCAWEDLMPQLEPRTVGKAKNRKG